ncbi:hypothetical protein ACJ73_07027 [Blastomyces percursus]|uniref:Aminoglycoside phosphotransferase domain-containing protein n=1 Tax=Blastomyces percursus TaxID=1658174 RepID=A0A1J9PZ74_9EURO|nr:hypothetical protein ACJ73_07027 [Blastomyces percursus]
MARRVKPSQLVEANRLVADGCINVYRIDERTVAKVCNQRRLAEAHAMQLVLYNAYVDESTSRGVIVMEYVKGDVLRDVWYKLNLAQRQRVIAQLRSYMNEVRGIKCHFIGSVDGTACDDPVFCAELGGFGPYKTEREFNEGMIRAMKLSQDNTWVEHVARLVRAMPSHEIVLTHSDFLPRNILVQETKLLRFWTGRWPGFILHIGSM